MKDISPLKITQVTPKSKKYELKTIRKMGRLLQKVVVSARLREVFAVMKEKKKVKVK